MNGRVPGDILAESLGLVERGMEKAGEHGPGVGGSIGRLTRVRPLLRFEAEITKFP